MSNGSRPLQILLVEDEPDDMAQFLRDLPGFFSGRDIEVDLHACETFEEGERNATNAANRYDLIISDTYGPSHKKCPIGIDAKWA
jgi:hypothetical protein